MRDYRGQAARLAILSVPVLTAWAFSPRLTLEQYEVPKQAGLFSALALAVIFAPGWFAPRRWLAHPALVLFLGAAALSACLSISPLISIAGDNENLEGLFTWLSYALLFLAGNALSPAGGKRLAATVTLTATVSALYGLLQQAGADPFRGGYFHHVRAFAGNPDFLAQQMAMALPLALGLAVGRRSISGAILAALFTGILFLTASRAGTLAGLAGGALLLWWLRRLWLPWKKVLLWTGVPVLLVVLVLSESLMAPELTLRARLSAGASGGGFSAARGMLWSGVARVVRDHPLAGSGTDTLKTAFLRHAPPGYASLEGLGSSARKAHNEPLHFWATMGVLGLGAYLWLIACAGKAVRPGLCDFFPASLAAAASVYLIHNLFSFGTSGTSPVFWLFLGYLSPRRETDSPFPPAGGFVIAAMAILLAGLGLQRFTADGYAYRGNEETRAGREGASAEWFARAHSIAPYELTYLVRWAGGLESAGKKTEALPLFERAWSLNRGNGLLLGNVGRVGYALAPANNPVAREQALVRMVLAAELAPTQPTLYGAVIMALQDMKRIPERDAWARKLQAADPGWAARMLGGAPPP